ncbi:hypothetical protein CBS101457_004953 [Exobasidium rhododendri]|nr:hypothetical protein CBS101457_004953 [Exobasidium rhododendri]
MSDALAKGAWIGSVCLVILVFQNSLFFLSTHEGRIPDAEGHVYFAPSMVVLVEVFKAIISFAILSITQYKSTASSTATANSEYTLLPSRSPTIPEEGSSEKPSLARSDRIRATIKCVSVLLFSKSAWKLAIPATLYVIQTNLAVIGAQNLDATTFMIASQLKFVTTALCTSLMLNRVIGVRRWISLGTLTFGVVLVQLAGQDKATQVVNGSAQRSPILGMASIIIACFISGFASVFLEKILKDGKTNLWATNIQLGSFGLMPALLPCLVDAWQSGINHPFMYFGFWAWTTVGANVMGGLVVALIMKYADNIQKSLAISASIVLTFLICVGLGRASFQVIALIGSTIVISSIIAYNRFAQPAKAQEQAIPIAERDVSSDSDESEELLGVSIDRNSGGHRKRASSSTHKVS